MKRIVLIAAICCFVNLVFAQAPIQPIGIGENLGAFKLKSFQGESYNTADFVGEKNVMLIFPRGLVLPDLWCPICYYQYAEIAKLDKEMNLREKYDLEILYMLPYPQDSVVLWHAAAEKGLNTVEGWKNPDSYQNLTDGVKSWIEYCKEFFPETFALNGAKLELPIPVLMDEDKAVSKGMMLFVQEWGGTKASQNIPTVFIVNKEGKVVFKYHSQYTNDRPPAKYLVEVMDKLL